MIVFRNNIFSISLVVLLLAGCRKQGPVELINDGINASDLEIINTSAPTDPVYGTEDVDTSGAMPSIAGLPAGQMIVSGSMFDSPLEHREVLLARAIFLNRQDSLNLDGKILHPTIDVGMMQIDGMNMLKIPKMLSMSPGMRDTLGVQYVLRTRDRMVGTAFQYQENHSYEFDASGSLLSGVQTFAASIISPPKIHVIAPRPSDIIPLSRDLVIKWQGGPNVVKMQISVLRLDLSLKPIFRMRVKTNRGGVLIPSAVLKLLPADQSRFVFSFISEKSVVARVDNIQDDVLMQAVYSHNLLLRVSR